MVALPVTTPPSRLVGSHRSLQKTTKPIFLPQAAMVLTPCEFACVILQIFWAKPHKQLGADDFVQERLLKIRELNGGIAIAYAGDVGLALSITDFIEDNIKAGANAADILQAVQNSMGPFDSKRLVQFLIVQSSTEGECTITRWDTLGNCEDIPDSAYIGSLPPEMAHRMAELFQGLIANETPSKDSMVLAGMAHVISMSTHEDIINQNVGGMVCGLRVQRGKTIWPDDVMVVQHKGDLSAFGGRMSVHVREGTVCINSTHLGSTGSILVNKHESVSTTELMQTWNEQWVPYLVDYLKEHFTTCTRWLFINLDHHICLVFTVHGELSQASNNLGIKSVGNGEYSFQIGADLRKGLMLAPPANGGPGLRFVEVIDFAKPRPDGMPSK